MLVSRYFRTTARAVVTISAACLLFSGGASAAEYASVVKDNVNVRTGPGTQNPVYMELFEGYPLMIVKRQGDWSQVKDFEGDTGWIHSSLIGKKNTVIVNAKKSVNMRSGPSTKSAVVADVERGVILTKVGEKGKWAQLRHSSGTVGWVYKPLLWP